MIHIKLQRSPRMLAENVKIDFEKMIVHIDRNGKRFHIDRIGDKDWYFTNTNGVKTPKRLSKDTNETIERAYIQWALEKTILGG